MLYSIQVSFNTVYVCSYKNNYHLCGVFSIMEDVVVNLKTNIKDVST